LQKSYVVKSPINFADFGFFVRVGDILVHDTANHNRLTVYRNGEIVKSITQTSLGMAALVKNHFIAEVTAAAPAPQSSPTKATSAPPAPKSSPSKPASAVPTPLVTATKPADAVPTLKKIKKDEPVAEPEKAKVADETV
jgi:hypothetical protein